MQQQPRNFSMAGAIDLGARQAAVKRSQQAAQAPGAGGGSGVDTNAGVRYSFAPATGRPSGPSTWPARTADGSREMVRSVSAEKRSM